MALILANRVKETCNSPGTGTITLLGALTGFQTFSAGIGNGNTTYYAIADQSGANWEVGLGTYSSVGNTLARTTVLASSNAGSLVNFSTGTQNVWCDLPASKIYLQGQSSTILQSVQTANFTAAAGNSYPVNTTSGAITVTLPASPTANQQVNVFDYAGTAATNNISINPNGGKINGVSGNVGISVARASVTLVYVDSTQGWVDVAVGNATYIPFLPYSASYLVVAGGGGGANPYINNANTCGGGAGGGGVLSGVASLNVGTVYSITVGAGGAGTSGIDQGGSGGSSVFNSFTAIGGGGGARQSRTGGSGGSGGGGNLAFGGSGTTGQGYAGGAGLGTSVIQGGGGGGAGAVGADSGNDTGVGGNGGIGVASSITGSSVYYAGGGGGAGTATAGTGGSGGGGAATTVSNATGTAGSTNTGGGAGGSRGNVTGANGGSGVVILSVPTANYSGITTGSPTVTTSGSNTIIKFTSSGSYTA